MLPPGRGLVAGRGGERGRVETEGRSSHRIAARPDRRRRENEDESRRSFKFIIPAFRPSYGFLSLPRRLYRHLISGMNNNQRIFFLKKRGLRRYTDRALSKKAEGREFKQSQGM